MSKEKAFIKLFDLIIYYSENRDQPVDPSFDFFKEIEKNCQELEIDYEVIKKEFKLNKI